MTTAEADIRIVLLGKTGSGKSSLANTILGEGNLFKVCHSSTSGTMFCQSETREVHGRKVQLIDTPGLFDTDPNSPEFTREILNCLIKCSSGVHAFLLVLKVERFTKHELSVADLFCRNFSAEALSYTTVVFTQGDQLQEGDTIKEWLKHNKDLSTLVERCGGRCLVFDNRHWKNSQDEYRSNQFQLRELFKTVDQTVEKNGGRCYTDDNLKMVQKKLKEEKQLIRSAPKNANMSEKEVEEKAQENTRSFLSSILLTVVAGVGILLGTILLKR